ncbi:hypothetical protein MSAN_01808200 [Mycena sanguinolenta]|uniref:DUF6534 domain-containing protein n=1 Tax=Mycena sanguinolenta TaxID=230812 RepID=A0A8H7CQQ0_9AGAR|nr:hypothetical protein MSAN_01808200 [Mycena sanguinolenta]
MFLDQNCACFGVDPWHSFRVSNRRLTYPWTKASPYCAATGCSSAWDPIGEKVGVYRRSLTRRQIYIVFTHSFVTAMPGVNAKEEILVKFFLGPWLIGSCLELILLGILLYQFVNYYNSSGFLSDGRGLRTAVAILCLLNVLKSVECFASLWIFLIDHFGYIHFAIELSASEWWYTCSPLVVAILNFYVQCYFCTRLWAVSQRWWVSGLIFALFVFALGSMVITTYYIERLQQREIMDWFAAHLISVFTGDVILSVTTAYFLIRTEKTLLSTEMAELIHSLIPLTFQTATPPAIVAMFNLIFSQMHRTNRPLLGYFEITFNQVLPKLYAISMMYTLNVRRGIRTRVPDSHSGSSSDETWRIQLRDADGDVELGGVERTTQWDITRDDHVTAMSAAAHSIKNNKLRISISDQKFSGASAQ